MPGIVKDESGRWAVFFASTREWQYLKFINTQWMTPERQSELPEVAEADGAAGGRQDEAQAGTPLTAAFCYPYPPVRVLGNRPSLRSRPGRGQDPRFDFARRRASVFSSQGLRSK